MLMIDVRNAIVSILERYTLNDVVEVTLRKIKRDNLPAPFGVRGLPSMNEKATPVGRHADPKDGFLAFLELDHHPKT